MVNVMLVTVNVLWKIEMSVTRDGVAIVFLSPWLGESFMTMLCAVGLQKRLRSWRIQGRKGQLLIVGGNLSAPNLFFDISACGHPG